MADQPPKTEEDERSRFEAWFKTHFGPRPEGDLQELQYQITFLQEKVTAITRYDAKYTAGLASWHERYSRGH